MPERPDNQVIAEIEAKSCPILFIVRHKDFDINDVANRESKIGDLQGFSGCLQTCGVPLRPAARCERGSRGRRPGDKGCYLTVNLQVSGVTTRVMPGWGRWAVGGASCEAGPPGSDDRGSTGPCPV